ncbi:hypothetical protein CKO25_04355 [Thiocapsa imhoffii]|uniref:Uncharacterized protein n=1 Tax=Thiocapsa imhoffii TaxID=382777 RepID=A0A9X0WG16_9GAMM|nr:hypothetical protein [Thiocapsa imhoffii]MBK1643903.1 hypothetical protein [Thiocapsa imhoffii]
MLDDEALSGLALSESTLSRDWLSDEEDAAWAHLQPELSLGEFRKRHFVNFPFVLSPELAEGSKDERKITLRGCAQDRLVEGSSTPPANKED